MVDRRRVGRAAAGDAIVWCLRASAVVLMLTTAAPAAEPTAEQIEFFEKRVRPLLVEHCDECHGADVDEPGGGLRLTSRAGLLRGGDTGPAINPEAPEKSLLIRAVRRTDPLLQMPPDGELSPREVETLVEWVRMGAPDPREEAPAAPVPEPKAASEDARRWWSFRPVVDPRVPDGGDVPSRNPVDRFVLTALEANGMSPPPLAEKRTLLRRVTFDLTGLPPTPEEVESFLADDSPDAYEKVVERLLASPAYGERWGRHWLDVARYADTSGCNGDFPAPEAYRYRDYVIASFNADKPYDLFLREQIAGDLLPADSEEQRYERIVATGYLAISRRFSSVAEEFHLTLDDTIDNLGKAMLGLTVACARCHDHKFDPIPQTDYYALYGIFGSTKYAFPGTEIYRHAQDLVPLVPPERRDAELKPFLDRMAELDAAIYRDYTLLATLDTGAEKERLRANVKTYQQERDDLLKRLPEFPKAYAASEGTPADARIQIKGDPENLGPEVPRGFLQILGGATVPPEETGSGRRQLAEWIADPANPLTARVFVNRVWQHHFGKGLVRTPDDFGTRGAPPTHPELLDWLASRFIESGWSVKSLHRLLVLSRTYRSACVENDDYARRDPENTLLWTFPRRRLSAEETRDAMLAVSGGLDRSPGGRHPFPPEWEWRYTQHRPFVDDYPTRRRAVYLMQQRIRQQPFLAVFDGADTNAATGTRVPSTTPHQALFLMNSEFVHDAAGRFADRLAEEADEPRGRVDRAYRLAFGRPPAEDEIAEASEYLERVRAALRAAGVSEGDLERSAWASYLRVLLAGNEFAFVE